MSYIQEARDLLQETKILLENKATFKRLLKQFGALERLYGELKNRIKISSGELNDNREDVKILWEIGKIADEVEIYITKRVQELAKSKIN
jgi:hypothetical protein